MILSVGEILIDSFSSKDTITKHIGGAPFNVAVSAKRQGAKVAFIGKVGDDDNGDFVIKESAKYNLDKTDICVAKGIKTTVAEVTIDDNGERNFKFFRENTADFQLTLTDVGRDYSYCNILHIGTLMLSEDRGRKFALDLLAKAQNKGVKISIDVNFRDDLFASKTERNQAMKPFIENADFLKMGLDELLDYTGENSLANAIKTLAFCGVLFVTDGANGSYVFANGHCVFVPTKKVTAIDTTGAGDAYWGTALACIDDLLENGTDLTIDNLVKVAETATIAGANAVTHIGAI